MSDNKNLKNQQDSLRINVNEDYEVQYWSKKFGVSKDQLVATIRRVGVMAEDVKRALIKNSI